MTAETTYEGGCFCGAVQFLLSGEPVAMGYCHCESCRRWSAGPVNAFTLWLPDALTLVHGKAHIQSFSKTSASKRHWCRTCGGHLFTLHPQAGVVDVYAALIPELDFQPSVHVHYQESVLPIRDGLTKMQDMPAHMGGSGQECPE